MISVDNVVWNLTVAVNVYLVAVEKALEVVFS